MANPVGRPPRAQEERQQRRRRDDGTLDRGLRLTLTVSDKVKADNPNHNFHWVNDEENRIYQLTEQDDWDKVEDVDPIIVGTDRYGKPLKAYLCKKPTAFCDEDNAKKEAELREQELGMVQGARDGASQSDLPDKAAYVPKGNSINRL